MIQENLSIVELVDRLGIDKNLAYGISGGIDNLEVLFYVISEYLEDLQNDLKNTKVPSYIHNTINRIIQFSYIVDNETRLLKQNSEKLLDQLENKAKVELNS